MYVVVVWLCEGCLDFFADKTSSNDKYTAAASGLQTLQYVHSNDVILLSCKGFHMNVFLFLKHDRQIYKGSKPYENLAVGFYLILP